MSKYSLRTLMSNIYASFDTNQADKNTLPLYFTETISNSYHSVSPRIESEKIIAKKTLGLETDKLLRHLEKFRLRFNFYNNWLLVFDQTYVSPLNVNGGTLLDKAPFMEASAGIEKLLHVLSIEYYLRFTYLNNTYATRCHLCRRNTFF